MAICWGFSRGVNGVVRHVGGGASTDVDKGVIFAINGGRCKGVHSKSMDV